MQMRKYKLGDIATVEISGVDKKIKDGEEDIRLCNFVDVYYNWAITMARHDSFMLATARPNEISKFQLKKGQVALTKDSETRDDIGISTYIADDFNDVILGYHCALITPNKDILREFGIILKQNQLFCMFNGISLQCFGLIVIKAICCQRCNQIH